MSDKEQEACAFMIDEVDAFLPADHRQRKFFDSLREHFAVRGFLSSKQTKCLTELYEQVTS